MLYLSNVYVKLAMLRLETNVISALSSTVFFNFTFNAGLMIPCIIIFTIILFM